MNRKDIETLERIARDARAENADESRVSVSKMDLHLVLYAIESLSMLTPRATAARERLRLAALPPHRKP